MYAIQKKQWELEGKDPNFFVPPGPPAPMLSPLTHKQASPKVVLPLSMWEKILIIWLEQGRPYWKAFPAGTKVVIEPALVKFVAERITRNAQMIGRNAKTRDDIWSNLEEFKKGAHIKDPIHKRLYLDYIAGIYDNEHEIYFIVANAFTSSESTLDHKDWLATIEMPAQMVEFAKQWLHPSADEKAIRYMTVVLLGMAAFIYEAIEVKEIANGKHVMIPISERALRKAAETRQEDLLVVFY